MKSFLTSALLLAAAPLGVLGQSTVRAPAPAPVSVRVPAPAPATTIRVPAPAPATPSRAAAPAPSTRGGSVASDRSCVPVTTALMNATDLTTITELISDLGLLDEVEALNASTIFLPSDLAFAKLMKDAVFSQLNEDLSTVILLGHIIPGSVVPSTAITTPSFTPAITSALTTFEVPKCPGRLSVRRNGTSVVVNSGNTTTATVVRADIPVCQGIVHIIDTVLVPCNLTALANGTAPAPASSAKAPIIGITTPKPSTSAVAPAPASLVNGNRGLTPAAAAPRSSSVSSIAFNAVFTVFAAVAAFSML